MAAKKQSLRPWDRRPWPRKGTRSVPKMYEGVGRALSAWERLEGALSLLFSELIESESKAARRSYNAVRTWQGRSEMLQAASETYFLKNPDKEAQNKFKEVYKNAKNFSDRRHDIAHGVVDYFDKWPSSGRSIAKASYCLHPSYSNTKDRTQDEMPEYCYTAPELDYFFEQFTLMIRPAFDLTVELSKKRLRTLPRTVLPHSRG